MESGKGKGKGERERGRERQRTSSERRNKGDRRDNDEKIRSDIEARLTCVKKNSCRNMTLAQKRERDEKGRPRKKGKEYPEA